VSALTREQWIERYANRIQEGCECPRDLAIQAAQLEIERMNDEAGGGDIDWNDDDNTPEVRADEELSNWFDDGFD